MPEMPKTSRRFSAEKSRLENFRWPRRQPDHPDYPDSAVHKSRHKPLVSIYLDADMSLPIILGSGSRGAEMCVCTAYGTKFYRIQSSCLLYIYSHLWKQYY